MIGRVRLGMASRLLLAFAVLIVPLVLFTAWSYQRSLQERRGATLTDAAASAQTTAALVFGLLRDLDGTSLAMSLAFGAQPGPLDQATTGPYLTAVAERYPLVRAMFIIGLDGRVVAAQRGEGVGVELGHRPYTRALLGGQEFVLSDAVVGLQSGEATITMARTIRAPDGTLRALLATAFYPGQLAELFPGALPADADLTVVDRRGQLIYSSAHPKLSAAQRDESASSFVQAALAGQVVTARGSIGPDGRERLAALAPVRDYGWAVGYSRTAAAVEAPLGRLYRRQLLGLSGVAMAALLVALLLSRRLTQPLVRLATQARAFGRGEHTMPAPVTGPAEVQALAEALNTMAAEVQVRFAEREAAEARYRGIFDNALEGIFQTGFDGRFRAVNPAGARMLGYASPEELMAAVPNVTQLYLDPERLDDYLQEMQARGEVASFDLRVRRRDGRPLWVSLNARAVRAADGRITAVEGMVTDITDRKRAEEERGELLARERVARTAAERTADRITRLQDITAALSEALTPDQVMDVVTEQALMALGAYAGGVVLRTPEGAMLEVARAFGYPPEVLERARRYPVTADNPPATAVRTGEPVWAESFVEPEQATRFPRHAAAAAAGTGSQAVAAIPLRDEGQVFGALALSFHEPRRFDSDDRGFLLAVARQCAQALVRARLYEAERRARTEAEAANRAKDEFLAMLSHELRTPLTPILGFTALLRRKQPADEAMLARALDIIERNATAQARLVADLLDVSRIVTGKLELETERVELLPVIEAAVEAVRPAAADKGVALFTDLDPGVGAVHGDPHRLQQVVWNLVANAVKFTPAGGRVDVGLAPAGGDACITVVDTGIGIAAGFLPHVFDRFRQADASSTRTHGGLGLGLAIVRHLVELHGGVATAASAGDGHGSTFTVRLPLADAPPSLGAATGPGAVSTAAAPAAGRLAGVRVLVMDDDADTRSMLQLLLEAEGAAVAAAASSAEALAALDAARPDVVLADIGMPGEDGYHFIAALRARDASAAGRLPVVALTAYASTDDRRRALAAGFQRHLAKPVDPAAVVAALVELTGGRPGLSGGPATPA